MRKCLKAMIAPKLGSRIENDLPWHQELRSCLPLKHPGNKMLPSSRGYREPHSERHIGSITAVPYPF